jgi:3,4-dihydroxy 2-butanone 4-phosphate synthase / GTP cyclohydrolase II
MHNHYDLAGCNLSVPEAIHAVQQGRMVLIRDDEKRENEADVCLAAQFAAPERLNFLLHHACGLICVAMAGERLDTLDIPLAEKANDPLQGTPFAASVDARRGTTTGIPASERALTIRRLVDPTARAEDFARPGHVFPLRAHPRGTLGRRGHTEAAVDLMHLAGLEPGAILCEALDSSGESARGNILLALAREWGIGILDVDTVARYREEHRVSFVTGASLPTADASFRLLHYRDTMTWQDYLVLTLGELQKQPGESPLEMRPANEAVASELRQIANDAAASTASQSANLQGVRSAQAGRKEVLVRLHSACTTGDLFGSRRCDCQAQLHRALQAIAAEGCGVLLYLPQEGRGIGLAGKLQAYVLQEQGYDTVEANELLGYPADARIYTCAVEILRDLQVTSARLLTNNPGKIRALFEGGILVERVPLEISPTEENAYYLQSKYQRLIPFLTSLSHRQGIIPLNHKQVQDESIASPTTLAGS